MILSMASEQRGRADLASAAWVRPRAGGFVADRSIDESRAAIERAQEGDGGAFAALFRTYRGDVQRLCQRMLGDPQLAEDAVNEVFLRAHRALDSFELDRPFLPWLKAIAGRYCIDQLRRRASEERVFSGHEPQESDLESPALSPLGRLVATEQKEVVSRAIEALPLRYRLPLMLRYYNDMDYEAIGQSIGVTKNQVGSLLFRAKRLLRQEVEARTGEKNE